MKVYIPFNMVVDTDFGIIRLIEKSNNISEYPVDKLKSFLIKRKQDNPILEYAKVRGIGIGDSYDIIMGNEKYYNMALKLSHLTDILSFIINTHKFGLNNELEITVGCNKDMEIEFLKSISSSLKCTINMHLNSKIKLNSYEYIFTKYLDKFYVDYLDHNNINGKRLYVANYGFNTIIEPETKSVVIDPTLHLRLESNGIIVSLISVYNKKK